MADPVRFLGALGKALSAMALYGPTHPARTGAVAVALDALRELQAEIPCPTFSFLAGEVVFGSAAVRELRDWDWAERFANAGVQRVEIVAPVIREEFEDLLHDIMGRVSPGWHDPRHQQTAEMRDYASIRFGAVGIRGDGDRLLDDRPPVDGAHFPLTEEIEAVGVVFGEARAGRALPVGEAEALVASLAAAMHGDSEVMLPLLELQAADEYTAAHAMNVAVLAMALAEYLGLGGRDAHAVGVAGLLRDVGMTLVPRGIVTKAGPPTDEEWAVIRRHPVDGARIILASEPQLDLAAVVAYEHHVLPGGGGYPCFRFPRDCHYATKLVQVCDVYDALRTRRFHRGAWTPDRALRYVEEQSGVAFDAEVARAFAAMMRQWERRVVPVDAVTPVVPPARAVAAPGVPGAEPAPARRLARS
ncbi:MAG TPA: HD domain-containing phosphohydrolase [Gemmatimonadaceae bacterium]